MAYDAAAAARRGPTYPAADAFLGHLADGRCTARGLVGRARARTGRVLLAARRGADAGRRARQRSSCVPDRRDVARLDAALTDVLGPATT